MIRSADRPGVAVHLEARGDDFEGISWDLWAGQVAGVLVAVSVRSARGGATTDLTPAVHRALARVTGR